VTRVAGGDGVARIYLLLDCLQEEENKERIRLGEMKLFRGGDVGLGGSGSESENGYLHMICTA